MMGPSSPIGGLGIHGKRTRSLVRRIVKDKDTKHGYAGPLLVATPMLQLSRILEIPAVFCQRSVSEA